MRLLQGGALAFDFASIEGALRAGVLSGASPLTLAIRHFGYAGEALRGAAVRLESRVPQRELAPSLLQTIWVQIDAQFR